MLRPARRKREPGDISDAVFSLVNDADPTKKAVFSLTGISPGTTRSYTLPNTSSELAILAGTQTFTGTLTASGTVTVCSCSRLKAGGTASATQCGDQPPFTILSNDPGLLLVPDGEDDHAFAVDAITGDIAAVAEVDGPFPELFGQVLEHPTQPGMDAKDLEALPDRLAGPACRIGILGSQEISQALQVPDRRRCVDQLWHAGAGCSSSVPQLASH